MNQFERHEIASGMYDVILHNMKQHLFKLTGRWSKSNSLSVVAAGIDEVNTVAYDLGLVPN